MPKLLLLLVRGVQKQLLKRTLLFIFACLALTSTSLANDYLVTNGNDAGAGSLRAAITAANANAAGAPHTIRFSASGVYRINTSLPAITKQVTIDGEDKNIIISGPGTNTQVNGIVLGAGSSNSVIRNITIRNVGLDGIVMTTALSGITIQKVNITWVGGTHYMNRGIVALGAATNITLRSVNLTNMEDNFPAVLFNSTATNIMIDSLKLSGGSGGTAKGIQVVGAANGFTLKNSSLDLDDPATSNDGDYAVYFTAAVNNVLIDSSSFSDAEVQTVLFYSTATNTQVKNSTFTNLDGGSTAQLLRFNNNTNTVTVDKCTFNGDMRNTTNDGDNGLLFIGAANQRVTITNNTFIENDGLGLWFGHDNANNNDNVLIKGNTFRANGNGADAVGGIRFYARNLTGDGGQVRITQNTFNGNNGVAIGVYPGNGTKYVVPNLLIDSNIVYNTKSAIGTIYARYVTKVVISKNSIYNNQARGIELAYTGNCGYEGANYTPTITGSSETSSGSGIYNVTVKMPAICGTNNCSLELFSNPAGTSGIGGKNYVGTYQLGSGVRTINNVTGPFPEITSSPYGFWTATLRVTTNNCGTSEFSNRMFIKPNGPAGISNGIALWLRGEDITVAGSEPTASGQVIGGWEEFSGGGAPNAVTVINNPLTKLAGINFNPVADMDDDVIRGVHPNASTWLSTSASTTVAVFNPLNLSTSDGDRYFVLFSQAGTDANTNKAKIEFYRNGSNNIISYRGNQALAPTIPGATGVSALNRPGLFTATSSATSHTGYYNGVQMGVTNASKGAYAISQWFIGAGYNAGWKYYANTDFAEVFTYNRVLGDAELQRVQSYMALKYALPYKRNFVLSDGTVVWDVTANAAHSKEIGALVRDNVSVLHQKQSKSFHADEPVTIALGSAIAATNKDIEDTVTNNLSVFMWGNDSASTSLTQAFTAAGAKSNTRMTRVWKVQKTNWADADITVKLNGGKDNNYLLISTSPTFTTLAQELKLKKDGTITLNTSLFPNGAYFTFGRQQRAPGGVVNALDVWVKADEGVTATGTNASAVQDQSASQRVWTKINTKVLNVNSSAINYNAAFIFAAPDSTYFRYAPVFSKSYTQGEVFSVQSSGVNNAAGFPFYLGGNGGTALTYYRNTNNNMYTDWGTNARRNFSYGTKNMAIPVILNLNSASSSWNASLDGRVYHTAAYPTSFATYTDVHNAIGVGYGSYFRGPISEIIQYKRKLNATERLQVNSYLALRFGVTLDQTTATDYVASDGTTLMWSAATNGVYKNNIAGIGRDDNGALLQKQSRSTNNVASGNLIAVGVGDELALNNEANIDSVTADRSFLVWADNAGAITYTAAVTGTNVTQRMARVWKVDKTNWADKNITIKLFSSARNTYLLISNTDGTFATIDQEIALNLDSTVTINSSLLPDGAYFTFGKEILGPGYVNANVVTWQRADDGTSASDAWYDFSGNGNDATQSVVADQPSLLNGASDSALNFNPGFLFKPSVEWFDYNNALTLSGTANKTVIWAAKPAAATGNPLTILSHNNTGSNLFVAFHDATNHPAVGVGGGAGTCGPLSPSAVPFGTQLIGTFNRTSASSATMYTNGGFANTATCTNSFVAQNMRIGARSNAAIYPFNGSIAEVVVYDRSLAAYELQRVHSYLALKYGITLAQATPTDYVATDWDGTTGTKMWTAADNSGYGFRIAGIGRDDLTKLFQKQSRSAEANAIITIAAGTAIATDNLSNAADIDDMSFLTWSDNNLGTLFNVPVSGLANATTRMPRVWKVDRTNWADQDITIFADKIGVRYLLMNATDPNFGAGTVEYAINTTNSTVTINSADLPDGAYFTLATKVVGPGCVNNGIQTWLRADYEGTPSIWGDFSGLQNSPTQATVAARPVVVTNGVNFNPALSFDNSATYMDFTNNLTITGTSPFTVIGLGTRRSIGAWDAFLAQPNTPAGGFLFAYSVNNKGAIHMSSTGNSIEGLFNYTTLNVPYFVTGTRTGNNFALYRNGGADGTSTATHSYNGNPMRLGNRNTSADVAFNGLMPEVIVYNRPLASWELQKVHSYLSLKYGITLDQTTATDYVASDWDGTTGTKMWTAADNTGYNFRITGIGRDDCDELHQKQSRNQEGGLLTIAIGNGVTATNAEKADTIVNNNSYLVFGDNNLDTTFATEITTTGVTPTVRMARIWKVDKTNWADGDITLKHNRNSSRVFLLISTDPTFATGVQELALNADDSTIAFGSDLLPDGAYFTLAKEVYGPGYVNNGVMMWLRADDGVSTVEDWNDYSGGDKNALQATPANQPVFGTNSVNYNPGFTFNGTATWMGTATTSPASAFVSNSYFAVNKPSIVTGARDYLTAAASTTSAMEFRQNAATFEYGEGNAAVYVTSPAAAVTINVPFLAGATQTTGAGNTRLYKNGGNVTAGAINLSMPNGPATFELGRRHSVYGAALYFQGDMNEIAAYNRILARHELARVNSYLSLKYGLTYGNGDSNYVATDWDGSAGTVYWTADATYKNNIAGIGRDDKTALNQKQSRSVNTASNGNMVAIALGNLEATNKDNTNTFTDDMSFLVWGDNGANGIKNDEFPGELDPGNCSKITRLQREWKVQVTGTVSDEQLTMYLAGQVPNSTGASDLKLLIDDDGDFGNGGTSIVDASSYDAATQVVKFDGLNFATGQYFTLVTDLTNQAPGGVITSLYTWYRADKGVSTATGVRLWADQHTNAKDLTQNTAASQPAYNTSANLINFNPNLSLDGGDVLSNASIAHNTANGNDIFTVVALPTTATAAQSVVGLGTVATTNPVQTSELRVYSNNLIYLANNSAAAHNPPASINGQVLLVNGNRTTTGAAAVVWNGTQVATGNLTPAYNYNQLNIGARRLNATNDTYFNGRIAEVAIYNAKLSDDDRQKVASYLGIKYGLTLSHNYVDPDGIVLWNVITNTGYNNNITGISRDDCNGLHQKQSKSMNAAEALVTIGNGEGISLTNADNPNAMDNKTALITGDDNGNRTVWTATNAPAGRERIARVWRVQRTGNVGSVTIQVPASTSAATVKLPAERNSTAYLLVSGTTDFTAPTEVAMTLNGDNWEASYPFTGGEYFTFATNNQCVAAEAVLTTYNTEAIAPVDKCYENGWILFKDPTQAGKYIVAIYDPTALIDRTKISARVDVNSDLNTIGKGDANSAIRLMRRMVQIDCATCYDSVANPTPGFVVRMFYSPTEKTDAENVETNNIESIKTANSLTEPHDFKWFKAAGKTVDQVVSGLTADGIAAGGQQWADGSLPTGQIDGIDYVDFTGVNGFSTFGGAWTVSLLSPLPVTWLDVTATPINDNTIAVKWGTGSELNNAGFDVERSDDGLTFHSIAKVPGQGTSSAENWYAVNDKEVKQGIKYFYRIKQTDVDGRHTYSKIVTAMLRGEGMLVTVMPNPVRTVLQTEIFIDRAQTLQLQLTDIGGKVLSTQSVTAQSGKNLYKTDMMRYSNGTYFMKVITADGTIVTKKIIVQKGL